MNNLTGYSKAMHSTWFYYKPNGILFDCGEGIALTLSTKIYAINTVLISHGHLDHIMGLPGLFFIRSAARGDNAKPLQIVYPQGDKDILRIRKFIEDSFLPPYDLKFPVTWTEASVGNTISIGKIQYIEPFATKHDSTRLTLGYRIMENRRKLKKELIGLPHDEIKNKVKNGEQIMDENPRNILVYTSDTVVQDLKEYDQSDLLIHECTFIDPKDVKYDSHSALEDVLKCAKNHQPKTLLLNHFSGRYSQEMCQKAIERQAKELKIEFPIWMQYEEKCQKAFDPNKTPQ